MEDEFLKLTFEGGRFGEHSAPLKVLSEFVAFQRAMVAVARVLYLEENEERVRVPKGFWRAAELHLQSTEGNCFTAKLVRPNPEKWSLSDARGGALFDRARSLILAALLAAQTAQPLPAEFPHDAYQPLAAIGSNLLPDEHLVLTDTDGARTAKVDEASRKRLAEAIQQPLTQTVDLDGEVEKFDDNANVFVLRIRGLEDRIVKYTVPVERHQRDDVTEALRLRPIARVRVRGSAVIARNRSFERVDELEVVDHERAEDMQAVRKRLNVVASAPAGWADGEGLTPTGEVIARAWDVVSRLLADFPRIARPKVYPTIDGEIQAEWAGERLAIEAVFRRTGVVDVVATDLDTSIDSDDVAESFATNAIDKDDASRLAAFILDFMYPEDAVREVLES